MVLENLYTSEYIKQKKHLALILGVAYSVFGIGFASFMFPEDPALISIAFISLMSVASLRSILIPEKQVHAEAINLSFKDFLKENKERLIIFSYLFLGILITFAFFSIFMPSLTADKMFENQVEFIHTLSAEEIFEFGSFKSILSNNIKVLFVCVIASFLFGIGTIFLFIIIWNASVIGVVLGLAAKHSAIVVEKNPFIYFLLILLAALPHIILEISSYFLGGISADKISTLALTKNPLSKKHKGIIIGIMVFLTTALILLSLAALVETVITPGFIKLVL